MRERTPGFHMSPLNSLSLFARGLSARRNSLTGLIREMQGMILPSTLSGGAFFYFQNNASIDRVGNTQLSASADLLWVLVVLATYFFCDTACNSALELFTGRLIAPFWHRVRRRRPASTGSSTGIGRSLRQWLCSPSRNEKDSHPWRSTRISHNRAPPQVLSAFPYSYT